jgi:hypothetical protein
MFKGSNSFDQVKKMSERTQVDEQRSRKEGIALNPLITRIP